MLSKRMSGWKWFDLIAFFFIVIVLCVLIQAAAPNTGLAHAIHTGFHALAIGLEWISGGLTALAGLLNQL